MGTNQTTFYSNKGEIAKPGPNYPFYGQDAGYPDAGASYIDNGDGTITDNITGLMWVKARGSKMTWDKAVAGASANSTAGYNDWRMPTIQELYSLFLFSGKNGFGVYSTEGYVPFIDTNILILNMARALETKELSIVRTGRALNTLVLHSTISQPYLALTLPTDAAKATRNILPPQWTKEERCPLCSLCSRQY